MLFFIRHTDPLYAHEFPAYRKRGPTPYMERLHFRVEHDTADPDERILSDSQLEEAQEIGKSKKGAKW